MKKNNLEKIFSLELNVGSFIGAIIGTFIYFLGSQKGIENLISISLTFAFPIYLLKLTRTYEQVNCNKDSFLEEILFPKFTKNELRLYMNTICMYTISIAVFITVALIFNTGVQNEDNNLLQKSFCCYSVLALFIASSLLLMDIVFDCIIGFFLSVQKYFKQE